MSRKTDKKNNGVGYSYSSFQPRNQKQQEYKDSIESNKIIFATGPAGTGKTHVPVSIACEYFIKGKISKIIISRPAIAACGEKHGFMPGDLLNKMDPFLGPIFDVMNNYWQDEVIKDMCLKNQITVVPMAFMRGRTFKDSFIFIDEAQNCTEEQMLMLLTRIGEAGTMIISGDLDQNDLRGVKSGLSKAVKLSGVIDGIVAVEFSKEDIVRDPIVKEILEHWANI